MITTRACFLKSAAEAKEMIAPMSERRWTSLIIVRDVWKREGMVNQGQRIGEKGKIPAAYTYMPIKVMLCFRSAKSILKHVGRDIEGSGSNKRCFRTRGLRSEDRGFGFHGNYCAEGIAVRRSFRAWLFGKRIVGYCNLQAITTVNPVSGNTSPNEVR